MDFHNAPTGGADAGPGGISRAEAARVLHDAHDGDGADTIDELVSLAEKQVGGGRTRIRD